ncbi:MAG TPA: DUF4157 domain-containing protein [Thermoanaerobaculia bacterium]|jgi:annexin A7/11
MNARARVQAQTQKPARASVLQRKCACGGSCAACSEEKDRLQRVAAPAHAGAGHDFSRVRTFPDGAGRSLEPAIAAQYAGMGELIERVRIHDDGGGHAFARREGAVALTSGADIYFSAGAYQPHTAAGRNLLSHELAHVWQQHRPDGPPAGHDSTPGDHYEREADHIAASGFFPDGGDFRAPVEGTRQRRTAAEQVASEIRSAVEGLGTDEEAIFNALTGRTSAEIKDIENAYLTLSGGETLEARLRDELSGDDLSRALSLLRGESAETEAARRIWDAVRGLGTDEEAIYSAVAGRTAEQWLAIQTAYQTMAGEPLIPRLQDELTADEWKHVQSLLPGAEGGAVTGEDRATVAANQIQIAVSGPGTDESAIYATLTGRSETELREIERRYKLLTGEEMVARLRDELSDSEFEQVQSLLHPGTTPERVARALREAMEGAGTRESEIMAILTGRPPAELPAIRAAYQTLYGEVLVDRLKEELSGADLAQALQLEATGLLEPADEIHVAVSGLGTDEERLFAVLEEIKAKGTIEATIDSYKAKGFGDMLWDIRDDLSGDELARAMELLHGRTPTGTCSTEERETGLESISTAISMAQNAAGLLDADIAANKLSSKVESALTKNFNGGNAPGAVTVALAAQIRPHLSDARQELLTKGQVTCSTPVPMPCTSDPCVAKPDCSQFVGAWTCSGAGTVVRLCPAFFSCSNDQPTAMLHEFIHHTGPSDHFYHFKPEFSTLKPLGDGSNLDSLDNADSFAYLAKDLY